MNIIARILNHRSFPVFVETVVLVCAVALACLLIAAPARAGVNQGQGDPHDVTIDPTVCAEICALTLADGCPPVNVPPCPDCSVTCPSAPACPSADQIVNRFITRRVGQVYVICKVRKNGTLYRCKDHKMIDALRGVTR